MWKKIVESIKIFFEDKPNYVPYFYSIILISLFLILCALIISIIINKIRKKEVGRLAKFVSFIAPNVIVWIFLKVAYVGVTIFIPDVANHEHFPHVVKMIVLTSIGYLFYRCDFILRHLITNLINKYPNSKFNLSNIKWVLGIYHFIVVFIVFVSILSVFDIKLTALMAGLGVGGVAIAFAAQDTLGNLLGFFTIFLDKPFVIGQRIIMLDYDGVVEEVGIRSVKLRTLDGNLVVIPNKTVGNAEIENVAARETIRQHEDIELDGFTVKLRDIPRYIDGIKSIIEKESKNVRDDYGVYFDNSDGAKIIIKMWYWMKSGDYWTYMETKERINYAICYMFEDDGVAYWMPTNKVMVDNFESPKPIIETKKSTTVDFDKKSGK